MLTIPRYKIDNKAFFPHTIPAIPPVNGNEIQDKTKAVVIWTKLRISVR